MRLLQNIKASLQEYIRKFVSGDDLSDYDGIGSMEHIDRNTAMKYSAVFSCIRVLGETFASCPAMLYKKQKDGREVSTDLAVYDILHNKPNEEMAPFSFKEASMAALNTGGNSISIRLVNKFGDLVGLYPVEWPRVRIERKDGRLVYHIREGKGPEKPYPRDQIFHVPGMSFDGIIGISPIEYMAQSITLGLSYEKFGVKFFKNSANASGAFSHPGTLEDKAYERLKKDIKKNYSGLANTGTPMLLEGGLTFSPFTMKPADAELLGNKNFQIEDVARCYRVPLHLIQSLARSTNNNIEHQSLEFVMYTMLPWFKRYEENANMQLLTDRERKAGYYLEFKMDALLRGDMKSRSESYAIGRQWGWLSVNDILRLENRPIIPNGDIYLEPSNMIEAGTMQEQIARKAAEIQNMLQGR